MSDGTEDKDAPKPEKYVSQIDDIFALAWNEVHNPEDAPKAGEDGAADKPAGSGAEGAAASGDGAEAGKGDGAAATDGALPTAGDQGTGADAGASAAEASASDAAAGAGDDAGAKPGAQGVAAEGLEPSEVTPLLAPARQEAFKRMDASFRQSATAELQEEIDPEFLDLLEEVPARLVNTQVPDLSKGAAEDAKIRLNSSAEAAQYQRDLKAIFDREITRRAQQKADDVRPMASVIQESFLLFENNPDMIPGVKGFDPELARRVMSIAETYAVKVGGKLIGFQNVQMQPLINTIRAELSKERGANGVTAQQQKAEAQRAAAEKQERDDAGKFIPQAGVLSKAGNQGEAADDYSAFWGASGVQMPGSLGI